MAENEKRMSGDHSTVGSPPPSPQPKRKLFGRNKPKTIKKNDTAEVEAAAAVNAQPSVAPVGFTQLFRFSTPFELALDAIGLFAAAAAGNQPLSVDSPLLIA